MPRQLRFPFFALFILLMLTRTIFGQTQDSTMANLAPEIANLIRLKTGDAGMRVDRAHWERTAEPKYEGDNMDKAIEDLVKRGMPKGMAKRLAKDKNGILGQQFSTPAASLFGKLRMKAGCSGSGSGGSNNMRQWTGSGEEFTICMVDQSRGTFELTIRELTRPNQELSISSHDINGLRIQINSDEQLMLFWQKYDGSVRFLFTEGEHNEAVSAKNYEDFLTQHPGMANEFWSQLNELGIQKPLQKDDLAILAAIGSLLAKTAPAPLAAADAEILRLRDDAFKVRKAAKKKIQANYSAWKSRIKDTLKDEDLDAESRIVLEGIVSAANDKAKAPESEVDCFIREHNLLDDREYLNGIVESASKKTKQLIKDRIAELEN